MGNALSISWNTFLTVAVTALVNFIGVWIYVEYFPSVKGSDKKIERSLRELKDVRESVRVAMEKSDADKRKIQELSGKMEGLEQDFKRDLNSIFNKNRKSQRLLQARIYDYSKELDFWRNMVNLFS